jgi:amino acid adenylation domain-containing protein
MEKRILDSQQKPFSQLSSDSRRNLLAEMLRSRAIKLSMQQSPSGLTPILRADRGAALPVSFSQERLWFLSKLEPDNYAYNIVCSIRFIGKLIVKILEQSLSEIIRRHEILRTTIGETDGRPIQVISAPRPVSLMVIDLQELCENHRDEKVSLITIEEAQRPIDLSKGPLMRFVLLKLGVDEHLLILSMHHAITDGWSFGVFTRELEALYGAYAKDQPSPLPALPIQYADFANWQREWLQRATLSAQIEYWKNKLGGDLPVLQMPIDRPRLAVQTHRGANHLFSLPMPLLEMIKKLSKRQGTTLFMTLIAAFKVLLYRYTGQTDFAVGSPIANRTRSELEGLIGFFVNTVVLRTDLSGDPRFIDFLERVKATTLEAFAHQDTPFEKVVEAVNPPRDMSYSTLFQVMFALQNFPMNVTGIPGLTLIPAAVDNGTSMFDLAFYLGEEKKGKGLTGKIEYNSDLFDAETIERMAFHFGTLLESIIANPAQHISELRLLTEAERSKLLVEWNVTEAPYPTGKTLGQLFEEQAGRTSDALAIGCHGAELTYSELNSRVNQLAGYLRGFGVGPGVFVGIYMERSVDMVVGLLGVLKAGGAYVPLDPGFPKDRLEFMLEDSGAAILITQSGMSGNLIGYGGMVVCVDSDWARIAKENVENTGIVGTPEDLAYVIYTSGSTGKPKGVQISQRAVVNFLYSMRREPGLTSADTILSVTTISFDIFGLELYLPLITGAKVVLVEREDAADGGRLIELLRKFKASVMQATPATWRLLLQAGWEGEPSLRIFCGGEALPRDLVGPLLDRCKELWNLYGPTETTIWSTVYQVKSKEDSILIGHPIANTQVYILDKSLQPVPIGVAGELHIGGDGLARGYLNRPELTAEKFIADPFNEDLKARVYKTGDLARYRPDGSIECLGRIDHQVKVRGYRIELGEIEEALGKLDEVNQCAVAVREDQPGDQRLVAYYVAKGDGEVSTSKWGNYLRTQLPEYMVPQHFVKLESMPLTPNGKVDRKALPKPETGTASDKEYIAPRTDIERTIAEIWKEVLKQDRVGVHDDFFELGGHSLLATQIMSQIDNAFNITLSLRSLFETPTVSSLAEIIAQKQIEQADRETLAQALAELEQLSPEEVKMLLAFDH